MTNRTFYYISNARIPTEKAHGVHMMKMCEAFANAGENVIFVVPRRFNKIKENPYIYYDVEKNFIIKKLFCIDFIGFIPWVGYWIQYLSFLINLKIRFIFSPRKNKLIYTREFLIAVFFKLLGFETVYESHRVLQKKKMFFWLLGGIKKIVTNSNGVADEFKKNGFRNVLPASNAVDMKEFENLTDIQRPSDLPSGRKIVMYTGHLFDWKGIDTVIEVAKQFAFADTRGLTAPTSASSETENSRGSVVFVFVGGTEQDVEKYRKLNIENTIFLGHRPKKEIPLYLKSADVLILPNSPVSEESIKYTSPMKLFEYMASGVPIVASDLPSIREVLNENNSILVRPDDAEELRAGIETIFNNKNIAEKISNQAKEDVSLRTWDNRAKKILEFITIWQ